MTKLVILFTALVVAGCSSSAGGGGGGTSTPGSPPATGSSPAAATTSPAPSKSGVPTSAAPTAPTTHPAQPPSVLHDFRVADVTWVGSHGWALGEADCLSGSGQCDAIEQTSDGNTWTSLPAPLNAKVVVPAPITTCSANCVDGIRFATTKIGYAFGPDAFYVTADGGHTWTRRPAGALFVETADGNTIRVVSSGGGCPGPCGVSIQTAPIGSDTWTTRYAPRNLADFGLLFARTSARADLLVEGHVAGGGDSARSTLLASTDDGRTWTNRGEPCPQLDREDDSVALSSAPDGALAVVCRARAAGTATYTALSTDGGTPLRAGSHTALGSAAVTGFGAASDKIILIVLADTFRSANGGQSFARLAANAGSSPGAPRYIAFSSTSVGHAVSTDGRTLWTTTDGGLKWRAHRFG